MLRCVGGGAQPCRARERRQRRRPGVARASNTPPEPGAPLKALWYTAEQFGKLVGLSKPPPVATQSAPLAKLEPAEREAFLRQDYDVDYFISGKGELRAYDSQCEFADPFVAFKGTQRFVQNVGNLGGLLTDVKLKITGWELNESQLQTQWRFAATVSLPWRPRIAAAGGTTHEFAPDTGLVVRHYEARGWQPNMLCVFSSFSHCCSDGTLSPGWS